MTDNDKLKRLLHKLFALLDGDNTAEEINIKGVDLLTKALNDCEARVKEEFIIKEELLNALLLKRKVDGLNGRNWDARKHLFAEEKVIEILKKLNQSEELNHD